MAHILTNTQKNILQPGITNTVVSYHSMTYCTRKIQKQKYINTRNLLSLTEKLLDEIYKETLERVSFPNFENLDEPDETYNYLFTRLGYVLNAIAPFKTFRVKNNTSEWFDGEIAGKIHTRDALYKNLN